MRRRRLAATLAVLAATTAACSGDSKTVTTMPGGNTVATTGVATTGVATTAVATTAATTTVVVTTVPSRNDCAAAPAAPVTHQYRQLAGVDPNLLSLDVYPLPASCGPRPALIWVHGGGWRLGDKANSMDRKAALAAAEGWVLVSVNYRLSTAGSGVVWPDHGNDVAAAVGYALDHAGELGIDPTRVALMGHSAGGQLAAIVTVDPTLLAAVGHSRDEIRCLVSLDTEGYDLQRKYDGGEVSAALITNAFGNDPATLAAASPSQVLTTVMGRVADTLVVTRGTAERRAIAREFVDLVTSTGASTRLVTADGYTHAAVNDAVGDTADTVVNPAVTDFLRSCLD